MLYTRLDVPHFPLYCWWTVWLVFSLRLSWISLLFFWCSYAHISTDIYSGVEIWVTRYAYLYKIMPKSQPWTAVAINILCTSIWAFLSPYTGVLRKFFLQLIWIFYFFFCVISIGLIRQNAILILLKIVFSNEDMTSKLLNWSKSFLERKHTDQTIGPWLMCYHKVNMPLYPPPQLRIRTF